MSKLTTGNVRDILAASLKQAAKGNLSSVDGKNLIGLANQISNSMSVEIKYANMQTTLGNATDSLGTVMIGDNTPKAKKSKS